MRLITVITSLRANPLDRQMLKEVADWPAVAVAVSLPWSTSASGILIALWLLIYVSAIFHPPLMDDADTVHAEAAREMLQRHDWVTLYTDGIRYLEKAPLLYWSIAASFKLLGVHTATARLPLAFTVLALTLILVWNTVHG